MKSQESQARVLVAALLAVGISHLAGCSGCGQPQVESMLAVNFNKPTDGQQLAPLDKSDPAAPGFAVDVTVQGTDTNGRTITLQDAKLEVKATAAADWSAGPAAQLNGSTALFPGTPLVAGSNMLRTTVTEKDSLRQATRTITVIVPAPIGCSVSFTTPSTSPFVYNLSFDEDPSIPGLQTTVRGVTPKCQGFPVSLYKGVGATTLLGTATADVTTGAFAIPITLQDLEVARLTAQMADPFPPNPISSVSADVSVKISPPVITNPLPRIPSPFNTLYYVADSNIHLLQPGTGQPDAGYIRNKVPTDNPVADFGFTVSQADGGMARLVYQGANLAPPVSIDSDPKVVTWSNVALPQQTTGLLQLLATDSAGNQTVVAASTTVDVIPPAQSVITPVPLPDGGSRTATVNLNWTASGDDGLVGAPAGYDLRWSTKVVLPTGVATDGGYYDPNQFAASPGGIIGGSTTSASVGPLPPLNTYYFQVRAMDRVGNYARQSPQATLDNFLSSQTASNPDAGTTGYGLHMVAADFDNDGKDELVVGAATAQPGTVYVYHGTSDLSTFGTVPPWKTLTPPGGQSGFFGLDFSAGHVADEPGRAADLIVSQNAWTSCGAQVSRGRAFLYLRTLGSDSSCTPATRCVFEFRGTASAGANSFAASARIIPDINGDGYDEVLISAHRENNEVGKVYLFFGRPRSGWDLIAQTTDACPTADGSGYIPTSAADRVFLGDGTPGGSNFFGRLRGYTTVDNRAVDAGVLFTIPSSLEPIHKLYVMSANTDGGFIDAGIATQTLNYGPDAPFQSVNGFGAEARGESNLIQGPAKDLVVTQPRFNNVFIFPDGTSTGFNNPPVIINSPFGQLFGATLAVGDINGDGRKDIIVGENASSNLSTWVFYNKGIPNQEFDLAAGALTPGSGFAQSRLAPLGSTASGIGIAVGDFNGDGKIDIAAGDDLSGAGKVTIWY